MAAARGVGVPRFWQKALCLGHLLLLAIERILFLLKVVAGTMNLGYSVRPVRYPACCECRYAVLAFIVLVDETGKGTRNEACRDRIAPRSVLRACFSHISGLSSVIRVNIAGSE